jgi:putative aldouronate transport system substrate-binding protein
MNGFSKEDAGKLKDHKREIFYNRLNVHKYEEDMSMRRFKLITCLILTLMLTLAMVSGCTGGATTTGTTTKPSGTTTAAPTTTKPVEVQKVVYYLIDFNKIPDNYQDVNDAINKYIAEKFPNLGVALEMQLFAPADYQNKINLAMQSGQQMDIFTPLGIQMFIANNQLLPINDLLDQYGQDVTVKLRQELGENSFAPFTKEGKIYAVPINKSMVITPTLIYDEDMLNATGFKADDIKSVRDLTPVFAKIKELYPEVYPFSALNMQDSMIQLIMKNELNMDYLNDNALSATAWMGVVFGNDQKVVNPFETAAFKDYIGLIRDWYDKGYLPSDMATSTSTSTELFAAGRLFCTWGGYGGRPSGKMMSQMSGRNMNAKWISPFYMTTADAGLATAISSTTKVPEAAMKFINLVYTDEFIINTMLLGIENRDYVKVDAHHWKFPEGLDQNTVPYTNFITTGVLGSESIQYIQETMDYEEVLFKIEQNKNANRSPYFGFVFDPTSVQNEMTALQNVYAQYIPGLVCGSLDPDTTLPEFVNALKAAGIDNVIAAKQTQLDAWVAANKK